MKNIKKWRKAGRMSPAKQSMFTGQKQDSTSSSKQTSTNQKKDTPSQTPSNLYRDIHEIPLINFARALCDKEYSYLYKEPSGRNEAVEASKMEQLINEYNQAMGGDSTGKLRLRELHCSLADLSILQASYVLVECNHKGDYLKALAEIGIKITGDKEKDLFKIKATHSRVSRELKKITEKVYKDTDNNNDTPTMETFTEILSMMGAHFKQVIPFDIPVSIFCANFRRMIKEIKVLNTKQSNFKNNGSGRHR